MHGQILQAHVNRHAKSQAENAKKNSNQQQFVTIDSPIKEANLVKVGQLQGSFSANRFTGGLSERRSRAEGKERNCSRKFHRRAAGKQRSTGKPGTHMSPPY